MPEVEFRQDGHVAHVRLNRPKSLNAINAEMNQLLFKAWSDINNSPDIWVAILSAEGERAFCAGADIVNTAKHSQRMAFGGGITGIGGPILNLKKPLIATVQGYALGAGFELALCADIIIAATTAQFSLPETKAGLMGECGVMHRAMRQLPYRVALTMILTGERLSADDAVSFGLVNEVVDFSELPDAAARWAAKLNSAAPLAVQAAKHAALSRLGGPLETALSTRFEPIEQFEFSEDHAEARKALAEKRPPVWRGR